MTDFERVAAVCAWEICRYSDENVKLERAEQFSYVWADGRRIYATNGAICVSVLDNRPKGFYYPNGQRAKLNKMPLKYAEVLSRKNGWIVTEEEFKDVLSGRAFRVPKQEKGLGFYKELYSFCKNFVGNECDVYFDNTKGNERLIFNGKKGMAALRCMAYK